MKNLRDNFFLFSSFLAQRRVYQLKRNGFSFIRFDKKEQKKKRKIKLNLMRFMCCIVFGAWCKHII